GAGEPLDQLVAAVRASARYRSVAEPLIRRLGERELAKRRSLKEAIKATKNKLHQVAGAYLDEPRYDAWLSELRATWEDDGDDAAKAAEATEECRQAALRQVMARHASTRERLPILDQFYAQTLAGIGPIRSVLDLACGLNPLALRWLPLADDAEYVACDIYGDMMAFLGGYFALETAHGRPGLRGLAETRDALAAPPQRHADLALILKAIPCLEQIDKSAGERLLLSTRADHLLISFPAHSLGGKSKGMVENYEARFHELMEQTGIGARATITRFTFATELAFLVSR
ncbi:MAG: 16S rRNA methyltransferase, partial [Ktedonobacterales bacterium]